MENRMEANIYGFKAIIGVSQKVGAPGSPTGSMLKAVQDVSCSEAEFQLGTPGGILLTSPPNSQYASPKT